MDVLTDVLSTMKVSSILYARIEASAPWGIDFEVHHAVKFCLVARGQCCLLRKDAPPLLLSEGDFVLTTAGAQYTLCDQPGSPSLSVKEVFGDSRHGVSQATFIGGGGETTTLLNGILAFDVPDEAYFIDLLPQLVLIHQEQSSRLGFAVYMQRLSVEVEDSSPGAQLVSNWLGGILFVHAIRVHADSPEGQRSGWLGALSDRKIAAALHTMHERVAHRWTVQELAETAGMSRSGFAEGFKAKVGKAPLEYLSDWRMHLAKRLLLDERQNLALIASSLGYDSATAFSKAFKARTGTTPSEYRTQKKASLFPKEAREPT